MAVFSDDFNRADGAPGGNWSSQYGAATITSGRLSGAAQYLAIDTTVSDASRMTVTIHALYNNATTVFGGAAVKCDGSTPACYMARLFNSAGTIYFQLCKGSTGAQTVISSEALPGLAATYNRISITWDNGALTATLNDDITLTGSDTDYAAQTYGGIHGYAATCAVDDIMIVSGSAVQLAVDPDVIGNYGACTDLELTGVNTSWTAGTPGSPTFTVNHGTISAQTVNSTTSATITYCPGDYLGAVIFTDPSTGEIAGAIVTSDPAVIPPTGLSLSAEAIAYIERSAIAETSPTIANREMNIATSGPAITLTAGVNSIRLSTSDTSYEIGEELGTNNLLQQLLMWLSGGYLPTMATPAPPPQTTLKEDTEALLARWLTGNNGTMYTAADMIELLGGEPLANHQDILTAISGIVVDNTEVIEAIEAAQGDPLATIKAVLDSLFALGGSEANYNLATVKTWIEAAQGTNTPTIRDVLNKLGTSGNTIEARIDALSDLIVTETTLQGMLDILLTAVTGGAGITIATATDDIIDAINGIPVPPSSSHLWPGLAGVTLGDAVALSDGLVVTGPLNGLLFAITGTPSGAGKYVFGDVDSWQHTGGVIFCTDNGDYERAESFGLERQIVVPRTMELADSAVIRLNSGWSGTVRPWTRN